MTPIAIVDDDSTAWAEGIAAPYLCVFVTTITEQPALWVQTHLMEHRGVQYAIRVGIARQQWRVCIDTPGTKERTVFGTREDAEITARSMINAWLKKANRTDTTKQ